MLSNHSPTQANPTNACQSLMLSNHSPTHLPSHKPSFPLPLVNHYLSFPPLIPPSIIYPSCLMPHSSTHPSIYLLAYPSLDLSPHSPSINQYIHSLHPSSHPLNHLPLQALIFPPIHPPSILSFNHSFIHLSSVLSDHPAPEAFPSIILRNPQHLARTPSPPPCVSMVTPSTWW